MPNPKNINLQRYPDGTPSVLRKKTVYTELHFYKKSDVLIQLTKAFCDRFLPKKGDRTVDQMVQAARSVKQNIAEGLTDGQTSFEVEIKLLGIAKGSNQELLEDYQDYLKHKRLPEWADCAKEYREMQKAQRSGLTGYAGTARNSGNSGTAGTTGQPGYSGATGNSGAAGQSGKPGPTGLSAPSRVPFLAQRYDKLLAFCRSNDELKAYEEYFYRWTDEEMANTAISLCHMVDKALTSFLQSRDREFVEEGGIRERMTAARLDQRGTQKQIIIQLEAEISRLQTENARLQTENARLIAALKPGNPE